MIHIDGLPRKDVARHKAYASDLAPTKTERAFFFFFFCTSSYSYIIIISTNIVESSNIRRKSDVVILVDRDGRIVNNLISAIQLRANFWALDLKVWRTRLP